MFGRQEVLEEFWTAKRTVPKRKWTATTARCSGCQEKYQTANLCARPPNLLEQRRNKNCLEPRAIYPKGGRAAGAAKTAEKPGAGRAFGTNKGGGGPNKIGLLCGSANQKKKKTLDLTAGEYTIARYRETIFENFPRTLLFLSPMRKDGQQKTDEETPVWGAFLQDEIEKIGRLGCIEGRLYCRLRHEKTTKTKKKSSTE